MVIMAKASKFLNEELVIDFLWSSNHPVVLWVLKFPEMSYQKNV